MLLAPNVFYTIFFTLDIKKSTHFLELCRPSISTTFAHAKSHWKEHYLFSPVACAIIIHALGFRLECHFLEEAYIDIQILVRCPFYEFPVNAV